MLGSLNLSVREVIFSGKGEAQPWRGLTGSSEGWERTDVQSCKVAAPWDRVLHVQEGVGSLPELSSDFWMLQESCHLSGCFLFCSVHRLRCYKGDCPVWVKFGATLHEEITPQRLS